MTPGPRIQRLKDAEALARRALDLFVGLARDAIQHMGRFCVAIPGGSTPRRFFQLLGTEAADLPWEAIQVFWTDERFVPRDHPDSNYLLALRTFLERVGPQVYPVPTDLSNPCQAARAYEQILVDGLAPAAGQVPCFDLLVLGMGQDGHIASLMPYSYALVEDVGLVCTVARPGQPCRISLTARVIQAARHILVLTSGWHKARILADVLAARPDPLMYPVHQLWPVKDRVTWLVDDLAAALLDGPD